MANALFHATLDVIVDDLRETAEFLLDRLGFAHQHFQHAILNALGQDEVMAAHLLGRLQLAIDAAIPLLDPPRIPGQVEMKEVRAVGLEVEPLARSIGRK